MDRIWKRLVIIISLDWLAVIFLFMGLTTQVQGQNLVLTLYHMIK